MLTLELRRRLSLPAAQYIDYPSPAFPEAPSLGRRSRAHKPLAFAEAWPVSEGSDAALIREEAWVGKLRVAVTQLLLLCAVLLALPAVAAAQPTPIAVERVWTRDAGGNDKTTFVSGETIQFAAQLNNSYGGTLLQAELTITTSFYNNTRKVDIPPGISTWPWNTTAPSQRGSYTVTVSAFDHFYGVWVSASASFTVGSATGTTVTLEQALTHNGDGTYGQAQTRFIPGNVIRYAAIVNNPRRSTVAPRFVFQATGPREIFSWTGDVSIAPGRWYFHLHTNVPADAPVGAYTLRVTMTYNGQTSTKESSFTVRSAPLPGWYRNSGAGGRSSIIAELNTGLRVIWANSYIYKHPGTDNLYWYAQVEYRNMGSQHLPINCVGLTDPSRFKEHMRGTANAGYVAAEETFCSRNPNFTGIIEPGGAHYDWAIFHNVPAGGEVALEWGPFGLSAWVDPWYSAYSPNVPRPAECPQELVDLRTCQSKLPETKASNLIVLVHGCCTGKDKQDVYEWNALADTMVGEIMKKQTSWEIVVWDWHKKTPKNGGIWTLVDALTAYKNAIDQSLDLSIAIAAKHPKHTYEYIHLIGHSAGARLIDLAAKRLANHYKTKKDKERPFIHLTFLDAFRPFPFVDDYGNLENYPKRKHYVEHYVDVNRLVPRTNDYLPYAFNFDITGWLSYDPGVEKRDNGHQWPRYWYEKSVTTPGFAYGYPRSRAGGNELFRNLATRFRAGEHCSLSGVQDPCGPEH